MDQILNEILSEIKNLRQGQDELRSDVTELRSDVTGLKQGQDELRADVTGLKQGQDELRADVTGLKQLTQAIFEQTADLLEFRTETIEKLDSMLASQKSLSEMYGTHALEIRDLKRRPV